MCCIAMNTEEGPNLLETISFRCIYLWCDVCLLRLHVYANPGRFEHFDRMSRVSSFKNDGYITLVEPTLDTDLAKHRSQLLSPLYSRRLMLRQSSLCRVVLALSTGIKLSLPACK